MRAFPILLILLLAAPSQQQDFLPRIITIDGRLTRADYERHLEREFQVPAGTRRVEIDYAVSGAERRTVVDETVGNCPARHAVDSPNVAVTGNGGACFQVRRPGTRQPRVMSLAAMSPPNSVASVRWMASTALTVAPAMRHSAWNRPGDERVTIIGAGIA